MLYKHPNKPVDAIARLLEIYEYDADKLEEFIDTSSTYTVLTSASLQHRIVPDPVELEKYRKLYAIAFENAANYLKTCKLDERQKAIFDNAIKIISQTLLTKPDKKPTLD